MASTGFTLAGAGSNNTDVGTEAWVDPGNITADDSANASGAAAAKDEQMNYLKGASFGFAVPAEATIDGIELRFQASDANEYASITHAVIGKDDSTLGNDLETGETELPSTPTDYTYGGPTELWGLSWTASEINAATFQGRISANAGAGVPNGDPVVDAMWINVHYHEASAQVTGTGLTRSRHINRRALVA